MAQPKPAAPLPPFPPGFGRGTRPLFFLPYDRVCLCKTVRFCGAYAPRQHPGARGGSRAPAAWAPSSLAPRGPRAAPRPGRPGSPRRRRRAPSGPQPAAPADPRDEPGGAGEGGGGLPALTAAGTAPSPGAGVCLRRRGGGACCAAGPHGARRTPCSAGGDGSSSYSPGGFTAAGVAILSLRRIKTNARGEEGCSEQPGGGGGGEGGRRQGGRAGRRRGGGLLPPRGPAAALPAPCGAAQDVRWPPRRVCSCAAHSEHVPGSRTCALGPRPPAPGGDPPSVSPRK